MNIIYTSEVDTITDEMLADGFFDGWPNPPSKKTHIKMLQNSYLSFLAIDKSTNKVVGFINSISDGVLSAYIPLLEIVSEYKGKGIGSELVKRLTQELKHLYMVDICHDEELAPFYARFKAYPGRSSVFRNYEAQNGGANS